MFVRCKKRFKDGKEHRYWSVVENVRVGGGRVVQRQVLYLGEINDSQRAAWCRSIEVLEGASRSRQVALFPEDREAPELECEVVQVRLAELTLHDPRQWGACWLALTLWDRLALDRFCPTLTLGHACLLGTGGGGTENQGVVEVIARYRPELHRYM